MSLLEVLEQAAAGRPPAPDGKVQVLPLQGPAAAVVAFSAHFVVAADVDPAWVAGALPTGDLSAPHGARFLVALADRLEADIGALDVVLARAADASSPAGPPAGAGLEVGRDLEEIEARDHSRVVRALRYRDEVRVWSTLDRAGHVLVGRGLAGRWEMAFEVEPAARGHGLGRRLAGAAAGLVPPGELIWAQVSPGHPASLRAVLAAGYAPVCAEVLLPPAA